jgi:hypothetical protein
MWTKNSVTGQLETTFQGVLVSIGETKNANSNGTLFRIGSVELPTGKVVSCRIYEKNLAHGMEVGESYRCRATKYADKDGVIQVDIVMSHLTQAARASESDFDFAGEVVVDNAKKAETV